MSLWARSFFWLAFLDLLRVKRLMIKVQKRFQSPLLAMEGVLNIAKRISVIQNLIEV